MVTTGPPTKELTQTQQTDGTGWRGTILSYRLDNCGGHTCNLVLGKPRQENHKFKTSLCYAVSYRLAWANMESLVSKLL